MASTIFEWYGYRPSDSSERAARAALNRECPFLQAACTKAGRTGVCSIQPVKSSEPTAVCPKRLYFDEYTMLGKIAEVAFSDYDFEVDREHGGPVLAPGKLTRALAEQVGRPHVGVFGAGEWGGEVRMPPSEPGGASYAVDFTLVLVAPDGGLISFAAVEVQTIDTVGTTRTSQAALASGRVVAQDNAGLNWENVSKRILPQLIYKGLMLQGERKCHRGMFFVTPEPVFQRVMRRLGNANLSRIRRVPMQPGGITFVRYDYDMSMQVPHGIPLPLHALEPVTISTSDMSLAFITPENLPPNGVYEHRLEKRL